MASMGNGTSRTKEDDFRRVVEIDAEMAKLAAEKRLLLDSYVKVTEGDEEVLVTTIKMGKPETDDRPALPAVAELVVWLERAGFDRLPG